MDPVEIEEREAESNFIDPEDLPLEIEEILFYGETDEEQFERIREKLSEAVVDSSRTEEFKKIDQVISFLIDHLEEDKYPEEIKALQSLLQSHPTLKTISLLQLKTDISHIVEFVLNEITHVDEDEIRSWFPEYDEMEKPKYFVHLLRLALLYQTIDRILLSPNREELLEELIEDLFYMEDYNKALELVHKITSKDRRDRLIRRFADLLTQTKHFKKAIDFANLLSDEKDRFDAVREVLKGSHYPLEKELIQEMNQGEKTAKTDSMIKELRNFFNTK